MTSMLPLLWLPCVAVVAWFVARRDPELAATVCRRVAAFSAVLLGLLIVTGAARGAGESVAAVHRWVSPVLVAVLWQASPFSIGVVVWRDFLPRPWRMTVRVVALATLWGCVWLAAVTGYSGPSSDEFAGERRAGEETRTRFIVWHRWLLPGVAAGLHVVWWRMFRDEGEEGAGGESRRRRRKKGRSGGTS